MVIFRYKLELPVYSKGFHLITEKILASCTDLSLLKIGSLHIFIQHTSASLSINENMDPSVREDMLSHFEALVPEHLPYYTHIYEGSDDMPAHIKTALTDTQLTIPVENGRLLLGTYQGIYLCEHRNHGGKRKIILTLTGIL